PPPLRVPEPATMALPQVTPATWQFAYQQPRPPHSPRARPAPRECSRTRVSPTGTEMRDDPRHVPGNRSAPKG
ncbi:MAG: hypothetical protein ACKO3P_07085, partial [Planctomycetaceae bacterium]